MVQKVDSNITGLRFAEEESLKTLPASPVWHVLEPNSYTDFGGRVSTVSRNPINSSRQRKKGVVTNVEASGGFNQDLTMNNTTRLLQGFFFADIREKKKSAPMNGTAQAITSVTSGTKKFAAAANMTGYLTGHLVKASGFTSAGNNSVFTAASNSTGTELTVVEAVVTEASPPAAATLEVVGFQFPSADVDVTMNGSLVRLTSTATDMTTLGLIAGEWIYLGGDAAGTTFANNGGFARIGKLAATYIEFDKTDWTGSAEVGTGKTIRIFFGSVLKNESNVSLIKRRTLQLERTLGSDDNGVMSEYLIAAVPNEFTLDYKESDKVTIDMTFVALDNEQRSGAIGVKSGSRPTLSPAAAFNTSSDLARIKLALVSENDPAPVSLFAFATDMKLSIKNNVSVNKALGVVGGFDTSAGTFEVGGNMTAYFADIAAVQAVRNNSDVTVDVILQKKNAAMLFDIPLLGLGDGRLNVQQDQAIKIPLETNAAESKFAHTLLFQSFAYLPDAAGGV